MQAARSANLRWVIIVGLIIATLIMTVGIAVAQSYGDGDTIAEDQTINGDWGEVGGSSTLYLDADILINPGVTINILPNTTIVVSDGGAITVEGTLNIDGPVTFTNASATPGSWGGIVYTAGSNGSVNGATIEYAQRGLTLNTVNPITVSNSNIRFNQHSVSGAGIYLQSGDHLITNSHIYSNTVQGTGIVYGGGIYIQNNSSQILNSQIYNNRVSSAGNKGGGGGIMVHRTAGTVAPLIQNCTVSTNTLVTASGLANGTGIGIEGSTQTQILNNTISDNQTLPTGGYGGGGGIGFETAATANLIDSNIITNNRSWGPNHCEGGGIDAWEKNAFVATNNLIYGNSAKTNSGGINVNGNVTAGDIHLFNNTIVNNSASANGGVFRQANGQVFNNIVYANSPTDITGTSGSAGNNLTTDPMFLGIGDLTEQHHLNALSPAIDAGTDTGVGLPNFDYDGNPRPLGDGWDIGFDEVIPGPYVSKSVEPAGLVTPGQTVTYTLVFSNASLNPITNVVITDIVPISLTNVSYTVSGAAITERPGHSYIWDAQDLNPGEGGTITIVGTTGLDLFGQSFTNQAEMSAIAVNSGEPYHSQAGAPVTMCSTIQCMIDAADPGDTVVVPAGTYIESLSLTKAVSVTGVSSSTVTVQAPASQRVMIVDGASVTNNVVIAGMTFAGGDISGNGGAAYLTNGAQPRFEAMTFTNNRTRYRGGAIYSDSPGAVINITGSRFTNNEIWDNNDLYRGGGVYVFGSDTVLSVVDSVFTGNISERYGGAIAVDGDTGTATLAVIDSLINNNEATDRDGGGIYARNANVTITNSTLDGNYALTADRMGGAIYVIGANSTLWVEDSAISNNTARRQGGGIYVNGTDAQVTINNSQITGNETTEDDGYAYGGGLYLNGIQSVLNITNSVFAGNISERYGGGIFFYGDYAAQATIINSQIVGNEATDNNGGGLWVRRATVSITDSVISNNTAQYDGGGIFSDYAGLILTRATINENTVTDDGGGIFTNLGTIAIDHSTISSNTTTVNSDGDGGGAYFNNSVAVISRTTFINNRAIDDGGAIYSHYNNLTFSQSTLPLNTANDDGGAIYKRSGTITFGNSTLSGNSATGTSANADGGAFYNYYGNAYLYNTTIADNTAARNGGGIIRYGGSFRIYNSIIGGNSAAANNNCSGSIADGLNNLSTDASCLNAGFSYDANVITRLGPLADNGGETHTHALLSGNPAINSGDDTTCAASPVNGVDQRAFSRTQGTGACDIGAYEANVELRVSKTAANTGGNPLRPGEQIIYTITLINDGAIDTTNTVISDTLPAHTTFIPGSLVINPPAAGGDAGTQPTLVDNLTIPADSTVTVSYAVSVTKPLTDGVVIANTAAVTSDELSDPISATIVNTVVATPKVAVVKEGPAIALVNDTVVYTFTVTNAGDTRLTDITVVDDLTGPAVSHTGDSNSDDWLDLTESWVYTLPYTVQPSAPPTLDNTVTVTAKDAVDTETTASDSHTANVEYSPAITLTKTGPASAAVGDVVLYTFSVSHDAASDGSAISQINLTDPQTGPPTLIANGNGDSILDLGETWVYTASYTIQPTDSSPLVNTATVSGKDGNNDDLSATAAYQIPLTYAPALSIIKSGPAQAGVGDTVIYSFLVTNDAVNGDGSPVSNVTVVDDIAGTATQVIGDDVLSGGETWLYRVSYTIQATDSSPLVNTVTATGNDDDGDTITASDVHTTTVSGFNPALTILKEGPASANVGDTAVYSFTVSHNATSDGSPVSNVTVVDDIAGPAALVRQLNDNGDATLDNDEIWVFTSSYPIKATDPHKLVNTGAVTALSQIDDIVTASDVHTTTIIGYTPALTILKEGPASANVGDTAAYTFTVSHDAASDGSPVSNVVVVDDIAGAATLVKGDTNGNGELDQTEIWQFTASYVVTLTDPDPLVNQAQVDGDDPEGNPISAVSNSHSLDIIYAPALQITANWPDEAYINETIVYTFTISHDASGDGSPVSGMVVSDTLMGLLNLIGGDNGNGLLESGEQWVYTGTFTIQQDTPSPLFNLFEVTYQNQNAELMTSGGTYVLMVNPQFAPGSNSVYLPLLMAGGFSPAPSPDSAPDLVVSSITVMANNVEVVIKNQGSGPVTQSFWVDLYVNPTPVPTAVNDVWNDGRSSQGIVWGIADDALPLEPGEMMTLTYGGPHYWASLSNMYWPLPTNTPIYAQVDSANTTTGYGAIYEIHEILGGEYNNISNAVSPAVAAVKTGETEIVISGSDAPPVSIEIMPGRP